MTSFLFAWQGLGSWWPGVYKHDDGHPLLGARHLAKSQRKLKDLGLLVDPTSSVEG